jgi:transketolase
MLHRAFDSWSKLNNEGIRVALVSISDWSDLTAEDLKMLAGYSRVVVLEDHNVKTGLGTAIASAMFESGLHTKLTKIGVSEYGSSGKPDELYKLLGMDSDSVATRIRTLLKADGIKVK